MKFHVADTLTGRIVGRLYPSTWDITDPVTGSSVANLTLPEAPPADTVRQLARQIVIEHDDGSVFFGGPIPAPASRDDDNQIRVAAVDWRAWWYRALVWPNTDGTRRDYFATDREQTQILTDLAAIGLSHAAAPHMVVDTPPASGVTRNRVYRMWSKIGDAFDDIAKAERGPDWRTYVTVDGTAVTPHVAFAYPYRTSRSTPVQLEYKLGTGGNVQKITWPQSQERPNLVVGLGSGAPPDQGWASAEHDSIADPPSAVVWPEAMSLPSGTLTSKAAFEYAFARLDALNSERGTATVDVAVDQPPPADYAPGDLARLVVEDGWRSVDLPTTRILSRTLRGVGDSVTGVSLTLDLGFNPDDPDDGEAVSDGDVP